MGMKKIYDPIQAVCKDCGKNFVITAEEQKRFSAKGFKLPKRCKKCREKRKEARLAAKTEEVREGCALDNTEQLSRWEKEENEITEILSKLPFPQISVNEIVLKNPSRSLVIIGNGFDLMHGVKSSYHEFQKTIGKRSDLRFYMENYLDTSDLWSDLEDSLGRLDYSRFLSSDILDMWLDNFGAYDPDSQIADYCVAVEAAIEPAFAIPRELKHRFWKWVRTLSVGGDARPFLMLYGDYRVLSFNYTEFIESLYGAFHDRVCYIHGCRKNNKPDDLILGHKAGMEEEQWDKVGLKTYKFKDPYKNYIMESALDLAVTEASWYDEATTKNCSEIIKSHQSFFDGLSGIDEIFVIGHSLAEVDYPYFKEVCKNTNAKWFIGYHSSSDLRRLLVFADNMNLNGVTVFRT